MLRVLSEEEARRYDDEAWQKLDRGHLFYIHRNMVRTHFIAVDQVSPGEWSVIELSPENKQLIIKGLPARPSRLLRDDISCMWVEERGRSGSK